MYIQRCLRSQKLTNCKMMDTFSFDPILKDTIDDYHTTSESYVTLERQTLASATELADSVPKKVLTLRRW